MLIVSENFLIEQIPAAIFEFRLVIQSAGEADAGAQVNKSQVQNFWTRPTIPNVVRLLVEFDQDRHECLNGHGLWPQG